MKVLKLKFFRREPNIMKRNYPKLTVNALLFDHYTHCGIEGILSVRVEF